MSNNERRQARYERRVALREEKRRLALADNPDYESVFSFSNLYNAYLICRKKVGWKPSVQSYNANIMTNILNLFETLQNEKYTIKETHEFEQAVRGRRRKITSFGFGDRIVHRCISDNYLVPVLSRSFIYDNSACLKYKGVAFAIKRMKKHLRDYYRVNGTEGYILQYDFSKYFDTLPHSKAKEVVDRFVKDEKLNRFMHNFIDWFGDAGLGLGSQVSQLIALACANDIDHYMKEMMRTKYYGRYMDDGYIISSSKEYLHKCLEELNRLCDEAGIKLNQKKTHITKLSKGFTFLKTKFYLQDTGRILSKIHRTSVTRMRRRIKKLAKKVREGTVHFNDAYTTLQSWLGYARQTNSYRTRKSMVELFKELFKDYLTGGKKCIKY